MAKVKRKVSDYPGFGVRRFSKLFPGLFKKTDSVFSVGTVGTASSRDSGDPPGPGHNINPIDLILPHRPNITPSN